jgi:tRNA1(Val) A37 N6-methylase TrmN6
MVDRHKITYEKTEYYFCGEENDLYFIDLPIFSTDNFGLENFLAHNSTKSFNCLDIGANIGLTSVLMAHYCPNGKVYAFEPGPLNYKNLSRNIVDNQINNL